MCGIAITLLVLHSPRACTIFRVGNTVDVCSGFQQVVDLRGRSTLEFAF